MTIWLNLENIILSETSYAQKDEHKKMQRKNEGNLIHNMEPIKADPIKRNNAVVVARA